MDDFLGVKRSFADLESRKYEPDLSVVQTIQLARNCRIKNIEHM